MASEKEANSPGNLDDSLNGEFPGDKDENGLGASSGSENGALSKKRRTQTPSPRPMPPSFMVQASPPKFVTFEDLMSAANGVKNMSLAHEIAVNSEFKLEKLEPPTKSVEKQVKEIMHKAFWDAFKEKISEDPPDFSHAVVLIQEVKENLFAILLPQHQRLRAQIEEVLDSELIQQKLENDAFDIYYYSNYVINILSKLCAPVRDDRIAQLKETKEVVPLFKEIFEVLDLMKMDMANFTIQQIRPYIQQQSVEYERKKFQEFLKTQEESGVDGLECTKAWLKRSYEALCSQCQQLQQTESPVEGATQGAMTLTPAAILNGAYMELLQWNNENIFPETVVMDHSRFLDLGEKTDRLTLITSVLLVTYNTVGAPIAGVQALKQTLKEQICTLLEGVEDQDLPDVMANIAEQVNKEVNTYLKDHGLSERDQSQHLLLVGQVKDLSRKDHPVLTIMSKRLSTFIQQAIFAKRIDPLKVPVGMSVVEKELAQLCGQFMRLISHNRAVFGQYYAEIIGSLLQRKQEDLSPRP